MINANMRAYEYYLYGDKDSYGQQKLITNESGEPAVQGLIDISITITAQSIQDNINYKNATYLGLTLDAIDDSYVIQYGELKLKVLYVNAQGRITQVFMSEI